MKKKNIFSAILTMCLVLTGATSFTACSNDDLDTNQFVSGVGLNVYGPTPVMRGGTLRFIGSNLDQISQVEIPGVAPITNIEVVKAGIPSEIRVVVPHDGPVPGIVKLTTKTGNVISTITELNYTEGLDPANITMPASAMPGDKIQITIPEGSDDYLDIIQMVEFADGVRVGVDNFTAHNRYVIEVVVPEEAKTGKLNLYTVDLTNIEVDPNNVEYQIISTQNAIEIGVPSTSKIASPRGEADVLGTITAKVGETITLTGNYYNLVEKVVFGNVEVTDFEATKTSITFALPAEAPDGAFNFITRSGVEVPVGNINTVKPSEAVATPNPVKAGAALVINGKDLDVVTSVEFPDADAQSGDAITVAADKIIVKAVPEKATEGNITLRMANGAGVEVAYTLVKPVVTGYGNSVVNAGGALVINGTNLDLVKTVQFGDGTTEVKVEPAADGNSISLTVPMDAVSCKPTLKLANGTTVSGPDLTVNEAVFCYATALPSDEDEIKAGNSMVLNVVNGDKLTGVEINGAACQWIITGLNKDQLIIGVPENAKKGSAVRLISSNGEITYTIDFIPNTEVTTVLWTGTVDLGSWSLNWEMGKGTAGDNNPNMFKDMDLQEGDVIRVYVTPYNDWWNVKFYDGHWVAQEEAGVAAGVGSGAEINPSNYNLAEHDGAIEFVATAQMVEQLTTLTDWGMCWIVNGEGAVLTKIAVTHYNSLETTLWEGEAIADDWGNQPYVLSDGGAELSAFGAKAGQTIYFYLTPLDAAWKIEFVEGHWGSTYASVCSLGNDTEGGKFTQYDLDGNGGKYALKLTQEMLDAAYTSQGWGGVFVLNGDNVKCTKITIE